MPISDHSRKDKEILVTAKQGTALDKRRQRSPETGFPVDFHWTKVTIPSCEPGLSLNFVVRVHVCHNITVRRRAERIVLGRFEQKATKTKGASIFVSFVSFCKIWTPRRFGCLQCSAGAFPSEWEAGRHREFVGVGRRFLRLCEHNIAEPTGCSEPRDSVSGSCRTSLARGR